MNNQMVQIKLAKESAANHVQEAMFWLEAKPMQWAAYQQLQKAIAVETLDNSGLSPQQIAVIREMWPMFRLDPITEQVRKNIEFLATDEEAREAMRKYISDLEEEEG